MDCEIETIDSPDCSPPYSSAEESEEETSCENSEMNDDFLEQLQSTLAHFEVIAEDGIRNANYLKYFVSTLRSKIALLKECHISVMPTGLEKRIHLDNELNSELIEAGNERLNELVSTLGSRLAHPEIVNHLEMYDMVLEKLEEDYIAADDVPAALLDEQDDVKEEASSSDEAGPSKDQEPTENEEQLALKILSSAAKGDAVTTDPVESMSQKRSISLAMLSDDEKEDDVNISQILVIKETESYCNEKEYGLGDNVLEAQKDDENYRDALTDDLEPTKEVSFSKEKIGLEPVMNILLNSKQSVEANPVKPEPMKSVKTLTNRPPSRCADPQQTDECLTEVGPDLTRSE